MKEAYLIIKTGCEGIEKLCYLTEDQKDAVKKTMDFKRKILEEKEKRKIRDKTEKDRYPMSDGSYDFLYNPDFYCVQKWNGESFECACKELGVPPSKKMLR